MNIKKRIFSIIFCISLLFAMTTFVPKANALLGMGDITFDPTNLITAIQDYIAKIPGTIASVGQYAYTIASKAIGSIAKNTVLLNKMAALLSVQYGAKLFLGEGDGSIIRDYNNYLYVSPQQRAMTQMNSFFNTVSRGRASTLNYEGVGPNYDGYLIAQARQSIMGQPFSTNLQEFATDPTQLFAGGNMKGIMSYMECANNVACYTMTAQSQYNKEFIKAQDLARSEQQNGFLPKKTKGRITSPAMLAQSAFLQIDQLGTQIIMNAESDEDPQVAATAILQVWEGASISLAGRLSNYLISDSKGREAIKNQNDEFPMSLSYNLNSGIGVSAIGAGGSQVGATVASGVGGAGPSGLQIGNTCVTAGFTAGRITQDGVNATVMINGAKYDCVTKKRL